MTMDFTEDEGAKTLFDLVKQSVRVTHGATDDEVAMWIQAAISDMERVGIRRELLNLCDLDPMARSAIVMYCKANYGFDNDESDMFWQRYNWTVTSLMNSRRNECLDVDE